MASFRSVIRLLPFLCLAACGNTASESQPSVPSGAVPTAPVSTTSIGKASAVPVTRAAAEMKMEDPSVPPDMPMEGPLPPPVAGLPGVACTQKKKDWAPECTAGEYRITVNMEGCSSDGIYGQILTGDQPSAQLATAFPPFPSSPVAKLHDMQFVCVAADARKKLGGPLWHYVIAIPAESVPACKHSNLCGDPGVPKVEWIEAAPHGTCRLEGSQYVDCAAGWVSASEYAEFSMGL